jgi:hypothetical protein
VALNGRIAAVTKTFSQDGKTEFSALYPESALRRGRNAADVFAVRRARGKLVLEQLRGSEPSLTLGGSAGREVVHSTEGKTIRVAPNAIRGTVEAAKTSTGWAFRGRALDAKNRLVDSLAVFADGKSMFTGNASDLRPLRFIDKDAEKDRFQFELPGGLLPAEGQDHQVRVFAIRGSVASELAYGGAYPWAHG